MQAEKYDKAEHHWRKESRQIPRQSQLSNSGVTLSGGPTDPGNTGLAFRECWPNRSGKICFSPLSQVACLLDPRCSLTPHLPLVPFPAAPACTSWWDPAPGPGLVIDPVTSTWLCPSCSGPVGLCPWLRVLPGLESPGSCCVPPCQAVLFLNILEYSPVKAPPQHDPGVAPLTGRDLGVIYRQVGISFNRDLMVVDIL